MNIGPPDMPDYSDKGIPLVTQQEASKPKLPPPLDTKVLFLQLLDAPMYRPFKLYQAAASQVARLCKLEFTYDRFCPTCARETPWSSYVTPQIANKTIGWEGTRHLQNNCVRCKNVESVWFVYDAVDEYTDDNGRTPTIFKVGQVPSLASFHGQDLARYVEVVSPRQRDDFLRAVEAAANGFAAGACTYLRRVLEGILNEARDAHMQAQSLTEWPEYDKAKTNKKMELLKDGLPPFLIENKRLYNLLSQGIHTLPDEECQELYPVLREAIELIFEEKLEKLEREVHRKKVARFIAQNDNPKN